MLARANDPREDGVRVDIGCGGDDGGEGEELRRLCARKENCSVRFLRIGGTGGNANLIVESGKAAR